MSRSQANRSALLSAGLFVVGLASCEREPGEAAKDEERQSEPCAGERPPGAICLTTVSGRVVDEVGDAVPDLDVTVCGPVCFLAKTDPTGAFHLELNHFVHVSKYSVQPHGSPTASTFYHRLPADLRDGNVEMGALRVIELSDDGGLLSTKLDLEGAVAPAQTVTSDGVSVSLGEGTEIRLAIRDALGGDEGRRFRARELEPEHIDEFVPELSSARVFALGPFEADMSAEDGRSLEVSLSVVNREDWPAGSEVEVLALGTYLDPQWLSPSLFESIGTARVSSDGTSIELPFDAEGPGLRHLTWIALRP